MPSRPTPSPSTLPTPGFVKTYRHVEPWIAAHATLLIATAVSVFLLWEFRKPILHRMRRPERHDIAAILGERMAPVLTWKASDDPVKRLLPGRDLASIVTASGAAWKRAHSDCASGHKQQHRCAAGTKVRVRFPAGWQQSASKLAALADHAATVLGGEWVPEMRATKRHVLLTRAPDPYVWPTPLHYRELAESKQDRIPLGVLDEGAPLEWDLTVQQYAHALIGGQSGSGKSNTLRLVITGWVRNGGIVDILDGKGGEDFEQYVGNPSVRLHTDPADMATVVHDFAVEVDRRKPTRSPARDALPRRLLLIDEAAEIWPVLDGDYVTDLLKVATLGRALRLHIAMATQKPTTKALTGVVETGSRLRDLCGFKLGLGRLSASAAKMMFDEPSPAVSELDQGRGVRHLDGTFTICQLALLDTAESGRLAVGAGRFPAVDLPANTPGKILLSGSSDSAARFPTPDPDDWAMDELCPVVDLDKPSRARAYRETLHPATHPADAPLWHPAPERPAPRPGETLMTCLGCGEQWVTPAAARSTVRCPECEKPRKVPVRRAL